MQQWLNPTRCPLNPCWQQTSELGLHCLQNQWRKWCRSQAWLLGAQGMSEGTAVALGTGSTFPTAYLCWPLNQCREQASPRLCRDNLQAGPWQTREGKPGSPSDCKRLSPRFALLHTCSVHWHGESTEGTRKHSSIFPGNLFRGWQRVCTESFLLQRAWAVCV